MAQTKRKQEAAFRVPEPVELSDECNAADAERNHLQAQRDDLKKREANVSEKLHGFTTGTYKIEGDSRAQAKELERLRQELAEIRRELQVVERALEEARLSYNTALNKGSRLVCEHVKTEWDRRVRECALATFKAIEAYASVVSLKGELEAKDVKWLPHLINTQWHFLADGLRREDVVELVNSGVVETSEIPSAVRGRLDI